MNAIHDLINLYNSTQAGETYHEIAETLLKNMKSFRTQSIDRVAEACHASAATLSRFARSLGYGSFSEFRANLIASYDNYPFLNHAMPLNRELMERLPFVQAYFSTLRAVIGQLEVSLTPGHIDQITSFVHQFGTVCFYADQIRDFPMIQFQYDLIMSGKRTVFLHRYEQQLEHAKTLDADALVIISLPNSPDSALRIGILREAKKNGAGIVLIKPRNSAMGQPFADFSIEFEDTRTAIDGYVYNIIISLLTMHYRYVFLS